MAKTIPILIFSALAFMGCYYDREEELYPDQGPPCPTVTATFVSTVAPLLASYGCTSCHGDIAPPGNVALTTYNGVKAAASSGRLVGSISHASGYISMPQGGPKMDKCDIEKIKNWVAAGALNN